MGNFKLKLYVNQAPNCEPLVNNANQRIVQRRGFKSTKSFKFSTSSPTKKLIVSAENRRFYTPQPVVLRTSMVLTAERWRDTSPKVESFCNRAIFRTFYCYIYYLLMIIDVVNLSLNFILLIILVALMQG